MLSLLMVLVCSLFSAAQQSVTAAANATVPPLLPFSSIATDEGGSSLSGVVSITFSLCAGQQGSMPLWTETQNNIQLDPTGHYSVQLGITQPNGVPTTLFTTGRSTLAGSTDCRTARVAARAAAQRALRTESRRRGNHRRIAALGLRAGGPRDRDEFGCLGANHFHSVGRVIG
jgi:hypothetical protein